MTAPDATDFIRRHLPLRPVPDVPGVRLHLANASSGMHRLAGLVGGGLATPYWAYTWAGGVALARYFFDYPEIVRGRRVLDFGAGSGLVAIAASIAGALDVTVIDNDPLSISAARLNADANDVTLSFNVISTSSVDLVSAGDVFYSASVAIASLEFLSRYRKAGVPVLIGDPCRKYLPKDMLRRIKHYTVRDFGDSESRTTAGIFELTS